MRVEYEKREDPTQYCSGMVVNKSIEIQRYKERQVNLTVTTKVSRQVESPDQISGAPEYRPCPGL